MNKILLALLLAITPNACASVWYVDGWQGNDNNNCKTRQTACKTIGHAISLASAGDTIGVGPETGNWIYTENLTISFSLNVIGSGARATIIDGGKKGTVVTVSSASAHVTLSKVTIQDGLASIDGGGVLNNGMLTINDSTLSGNVAAFGGGIFNNGTLRVNDSTLNLNIAEQPGAAASRGGGIYNSGTLAINDSTISGNSASGEPGSGGGIYNYGTLTIDNSTLSQNIAKGYFQPYGGGIGNDVGGTLTINNSTVSGNIALRGPGGGIALVSGTVTLQNSIVANNAFGNCSGFITSHGYNLSSDNSCNFNGPGDLNNIDPKLGTLGNNGGPTETIPLLSGSPAIDAGDPNGCTDGQGHLLKTDQRGAPRPDREDAGGCDMGAFERQSD